MPKKRGKMIINAGVNVWPHEQKTAEALANAGHTVEFMLRSDEPYATSADCIMDGRV